MRPDLAAARIVFPASAAHDKAPTKIGVASLLAPFAPGQTFDISQLGEVLGTATLPKMDAGDAWSPPREFKLDVTRHLRAILSGDAKFNGFALRVVPDRGVDDGWTVRVQLPPQPKIYLEIDAYSGSTPPLGGK